jgi:hypothetical protein
MHYPSDVAVGIVLGTALGALVPLPREEVPLPPVAPATPAAADASPLPSPEEAR